MRKVLLILCLVISAGLYPVHAQNGNFPPSGGGSTVVTSTTALPGINVKAAKYGAFGDTQGLPAAGFPGGNDMTFAGASFVASDVGKKIGCFSGGTVLSLNGLPNIIQTTITAVVSSTRVTVASVVNGGSSGAGLCYYGHDDTTALLAANTDLNAAIRGQYQSVSTGTPPAIAPYEYFPAGGYLWCPTSNTQAMINVSTSNLSGFTVYGDGPEATYIYLCSAPAVISNSNSTFYRWANTAGGVLRDMTFYGGNFGAGASAISGNEVIDRVHVYAWGNASNGGAAIGGGTHILHTNVSSSYIGFSCTNNEDISDSVSSNNVVNLLMNGVVGGGGGGGGSGCRWRGGLLDECAADGTSGGQVGQQACVIGINAKDSYISGTGMFACTNGTPCWALYADSQSSIHLTDDVLGQFSGGGGLKILPGGMVTASDTRFFGAASNFCMSLVATSGVAGILKDMGGNTCTIDVSIAAVGTPGLTEAVNTVTLTTAAAAAHGCHVGDIAEIASVGADTNPGYGGNWIVATVPSASTLTYINSTSGLANKGAGVVRCAMNLSQITGTGLPLSVSTHSANTFILAVTPATSTLIGNMKPDQNLKITHVQASSSTTTACVTPPIVTFTNGVNSATLTLTTAKAQWDDTVDASSGFPVTFTSGTTFTATVGANTCATPPTNLAITYTWTNIINP